MTRAERRHLTWVKIQDFATIGIVPVALGAVLALGNAVLAGEAVAPGGATSSVFADALVAQAEGMRQAGDLVTARELTVAALLRDPGHQRARVLMETIDRSISGRPMPLEGDPSGNQVRVQATLAEARMLAGRAELLAASGRYEDAGVLLAQANLSLAPFRAQPLVADELNRLADRQADYEKQLVLTRDTDGRAARDGARRAAEAQTVRSQSSAAATLAERIARIEELERKGFIESALGVCRRLVDEYPSDQQVAALYARLITSSHAARELSIEEQRAELLQETHERLERSLIPTGFDGWPDFPADWHLRRSEGSALDAPLKLEPWEEAINEKLAARLSYNLVEQNALDVLPALAKQVGVNLVIDPTVFANGDVVITLKATDITFRNTLAWICRLVDTTWQVDRGAVFIGGTQETTGVLAIYDVSELLFVPKDQVGKQLAIGATSGTSGGGGGIDLFAAPAEDDAAPALSPEDLVDLIQQGVSPTIWSNEDYGISIRGTTLLVTAPTATHLLIQEFIRSQANQRSRLVRVHARWLTVTDGYLEEIGVDWRSDSAGNPSVISPTPLQLPGVAPHNFLTQSGYHRLTNHFDHQGSLINNLPARANSPTSAFQASGLNLQALLINSTLSSAILSAVQQNRKGTILEAPELVTMSGVRANTFSGIQYAYISDYEASPPALTFAGTLDPEISVLNLGAVLDIKPYVSSDGKYVTMEFRPSIASLQNVFIETITALRFVPLIPSIPFVIDDDDPVPGIIVETKFPIELPNVLVRSVATTIMVPDGSTILVGGFGKVIEQTMSTKLPFLGHVPFLGRLFGKRGRYSDRSQLYLLADINIINYAELEAKL